MPPFIGPGDAVWLPRNAHSQLSRACRDDGPASSPPVELSAAPPDRPALSPVGAPAPRGLALSASMFAHLAVAVVVVLLVPPPPATIEPTTVPVRLLFVEASPAAEPLAAEPTPPPERTEPRAEVPHDTVLTDVTPPIAQAAPQPPQQPRHTAAKPRIKSPDPTSPSPLDAPSPSAAASASPLASTVTRNVVPIAQPAPIYPMAARRQRIEGEAILRIEVDESGVPSAVAVQHSSGSAALDEAAIIAAKRWRFSPALANGRAVVASVAVPVRFRLVD